MPLPKTTHFWKLDTRQLLRGASTGFGSLRWPHGPSATYAVISTISGGFLSLEIGGARTWLELTRTRQRLGGWRRWVLCPAYACRRRCAVLYLSRAGWRCRRCLGAVYPSTRESPRDRLYRRARRLRARLGLGGDLTEIVTKPPRMHWRTFERLEQRCDEVDDKVTSDMRRMLERWGRWAA
jgi:hypothetical protein